MNYPRILQIAHLVMYLTDKKTEYFDKVDAIKNARDSGIITADDALELAMEFCNA